MASDFFFSLCPLCLCGSNLTLRKSESNSTGELMHARILLMLTACLAAGTIFIPGHSATGHADPKEDIRELKLRDWEPRSMMVTKATVVEKPLYPVIDMHNHLGGGKERLT